jgi:acyl-CoA synthetase (AMP-forming)/AMP-acid ligase II
MSQPDPQHGWVFADTWDDHATRFPDAAAVVHGHRTTSWADFAARAHGLAHGLHGLGLRRGDHVAVALPNGPEYLEVFYALSVGSMVHVNTNYRYGVDELTALWSGMRVSAVVLDDSLLAHAEVIRHRLPGIRWVLIGTRTGVPAWATGYDAIVGDTSWEPPHRRSGDDLVVICTGGTTGRPKGVLWRQDDMLRALRARAFGPHADPLPDTFDRAVLRTLVEHPGTRGIPAAPLMHATGLVNSFAWLIGAGTVVTVPGRFDPARLFDAVESNGVHALTIVGNAFAVPMLNTLDAQPGRWDLTSLVRIFSSGVAWSPDIKRGLLAHMPGAALVDGLGASEAIGMASSTTTIGHDDGPTFLPTVTSVIVRDGRVDNTPDAVGVLAAYGHVPIGYLDDPDGSTVVFPVIDGRRYSVPGDQVSRGPDGRVTLLGRGSACINTGGEKVYPEEVEAAIRSHPSVVDVAVVGRPDARWGETVVAFVETADDVLRPSALVDWARRSVAGYKVPRTVVLVPSLDREVNGKLDRRRLRTAAVELQLD